MDNLELLWRGGLAGLAISAPVGPVNVLCVSRTISKGRISGLVSGLGAATADTIYGAMAGFSLNFVIAFLLREESWIRLFGGMLLVALGVAYFFKKPPDLVEPPEMGGKPVIREKREGSARSDYATAFFLNLTNPTTVLSFLAVLAAIHLGGPRAWWSTAYLVLGIFFGAMLWWFALAMLAGCARHRFDRRAVIWLNRIAGLAIGGFGVLMILLSRAHVR